MDAAETDMRYGHARAREFAFHDRSGIPVFSAVARTEAEALRQRLEGGGSLAGLDLAGRTLRGLDLSDADLTGADLRGADLRGCPVGFARFDGCDLSGADLAGAVGTGTSFRGAELGRKGERPAVLDGADLAGARFDGARLTGASLCNANLERAGLSGAVLRAVAFRGSRLGDAEHGGADYRDCDFTGADLRPLAGPPRRGVTRLDRTAGTNAVSNVFERAHLGADVPAFAWDRRLSALSKAMAVGLAGAAVAGGVALGGHAAGLAADAARHVVDASALADRLEAHVHYRHVADLLANVAPVRWASAHGTALAAAVVSGALLLRDKATDKAKDLLSGKVRKALDGARPLVVEVARRAGNLAGVVAAVTAHPGAAGTLLRALARTGASPDGPAAPVRDLCLGDVHVVVCTSTNLNRAMEWLATSLGPGDRPTQDVVLVRDRTGPDGAPDAIRLHAEGGMTALWRGADGVVARAFPPSAFHPHAGSPWVTDLSADGPEAVMAAFENAVLRDHLPGLDVRYVRGRGRVEFGPDGRVAVFGSAADGQGRVHRGLLTDVEGAAPTAPGR